MHKKCSPNRPVSCPQHTQTHCRCMCSLLSCLSSLSFLSLKSGNPTHLFHCVPLSSSNGMRKMLNEASFSYGSARRDGTSIILLMVQVLLHFVFLTHQGLFSCSSSSTSLHTLSVIKCQLNYCSGNHNSINSKSESIARSRAPSWQSMKLTFPLAPSTLFVINRSLLSALFQINGIGCSTTVCNFLAPLSSHLERVQLVAFFHYVRPSTFTIEMFVCKVLT